MSLATATAISTPPSRRLSAASLVLIVSLPAITIARFVIWLAIGLVIYFVYGRRKSAIHKPSPGGRSRPGSLSRRRCHGVAILLSRTAMLPMRRQGA